MIRETVLFFLIAAAAAFVGVMLARRQAPPPEFPLVASSSPRVMVGRPPQILVPLCPLAPWNGIAPRERIA